MKLILGLLLTFTTAQAGDKICVKNELNSGMNVCEAFPKDFTYLVNVDPDAMFETCTRKRSASFCEMSPADFVWVTSKAKERVCVQRFDTAIVDLCPDNPKSFSYVWVDGAE